MAVHRIRERSEQMRELPKTPPPDQATRRAGIPRQRDGVFEAVVLGSVGLQAQRRRPTRGWLRTGGRTETARWPIYRPIERRRSALHDEARDWGGNCTNLNSVWLQDMVTGDKRC